MLFLMQPYPGGAGTPPSGDPVTVSYAAFQIVPVAFFTILLCLLTEVTRGR